MLHQAKYNVPMVQGFCLFKKSIVLHKRRLNLKIVCPEIVENMKTYYFKDEL